MLLKSTCVRSLAGCALLVLAGCTTVAAGNPASPDTANEPADYALRPGEKVVLGDHSTLLYARLASDSRCAPDVQCVWAGDAQVEFEWTPSKGVGQSFALHTGIAPRQHPIGTSTVTLVSLARGAAPEAKVHVDPPAGP